MAKTSAGLLMYRFKDKEPQVFLVHPGGPFFKNNDRIWSLPKGEQHDQEDVFETAKREFNEETEIEPHGEFSDLGFVEYNGKKVYAWAFENDLPKDFILKSNPSKFGWPENDKAEFFDLETAGLKIFPGQKEFLERLLKKVSHLP